LWCFSFYDNWNDGYYIGLDRIEFFDSHGKIIDIASIGAIVDAIPYSLADIGISKDERTPDQLFRIFDLNKHELLPDFSWLCPLSRCMTPVERLSKIINIKDPNSEEIIKSLPQNNSLFILFPFPISVSYIR
jgi:hypothetical protein